MRPGKLDRRITFQRATLEDDGLQSHGTKTWNDLATVWASVVPVSDGERMRAASMNAIISHRITVRWSSALADLTAKDRALFDGRVLELGPAKEVERRRWLEISASEAV